MGITSHEAKAVLALRDRFSRDPIVFDIGSNKGGWADILVENVKEMHLFEPNILLLNYTQVRYDKLSNVRYNNVAVFREEGAHDYFYFTNNNNGLSSLYYNQFWVDQGLPMQTGRTQTITLDGYWPSDSTIDFVKIDVEGADYDVLLGAKHLLKQKQIKFIQIEFSNHYALAGRTFNDVIELVRKYNYDIYHFDGNDFIRLDKDPAEYGAENFYIMAEYTQDWNAEFKKNTKGISVDTALEIGCFEGLTSTFICATRLNPGGRLICVDPHEDYHVLGHKDNHMFIGQYERFVRNTAGRPIEHIRKKSMDAVDQLKDLRFGLIYIDGDHSEDAVFNDAVQYWNVLLDGNKNHGGYMLFDDYGQDEATKRGIDRFLETQKGNYEILVKDYQVLIHRIR